MAANGLELSCPAEAGKLRRTPRHASGQDKHPRRPSAPGQLQRVVTRRQRAVKGIGRRATSSPRPQEAARCRDLNVRYVQIAPRRSMAAKSPSVVGAH